MTFEAQIGFRVLQYPALEVEFELKSGLIHLLPTFRGLENEDPYKHLKEFHVV